MSILCCVKSFNLNKNKSSGFVKICPYSLTIICPHDKISSVLSYISPLYFVRNPISGYKASKVQHKVCRYRKGMVINMKRISKFSILLLLVLFLCSCSEQGESSNQGNLNDIDSTLPVLSIETVSRDADVMDFVTKPVATQGINVTSLSPAIAFASIVLPVPGGPTSSTPLGMLAPISRYLSGLWR